MPHYICATCGVQYAETVEPPERCIICEDERQYVGFDGQLWTTLDELRGTHRNRFDELEPGLVRIGTEPSFAIGQHAYLVPSGDGNVLWDCITLIDEITIAQVAARGGLGAIAISHPHYYSTIVEWSRTFGGVPIWLHAADRRWVTRPDPAIRFWEGNTLQLAPGLTLVLGAGHFDGSAMLHWAAGANGRGALMAGDTIQVVHDRRWVSFMYSFPNYIPLSASKVKRIVESVADLQFDRIYSPWQERIVWEDGKGALARSYQRYLQALKG